MLGRRHGADDASTSAIGLIVGGAILATAFIGAQVLVAQPGGMDARPAALEVAAMNALDVIIGQSGLGPAGADWSIDGDSIERFGLAKDGELNFLDYVKIKALRNGTMSIASNDAPDYPDVRVALGIREGDFHIRSYPVLPGMDDPRWSKDPRGRIAYVAHYASPTGYATITPSSTTSDGFLNVTVTIRNDGVAPHIFTANVGGGNLASTTVIETEQRHTRLLLPGEEQTVWSKWPVMSYSPALTGYQVEVSDAYGNVIHPATWYAATAPTGASVEWAPKLSAGSSYYETGEPVKFLLDDFKGDGSRWSQGNNGPSAKFVLVGPNGAVWKNETVTLEKNKPYTWTCANCTTVGNYTALLWDAGVTRSARDNVHVSADEMFEERDSISATGLKEISLISQLVSGFNGAEFNPDSNPSGDVFSDTSHLRELDNVISRYSTLIVGGEVRQNALNDGDTKWAIAEWVQGVGDEPGGNLIVLGTHDSQSNWLEPVYHAAQANANGGISAPDPTHPVLQSPERMDYERYLDNARAWRIRDDQPFTHILSRAGATGNARDDTLAIANPGAYNDGTVVLTSYIPAALTSPQDDAEALRFLHNLMSQSYNMLFMDFGPPIPEGVPVGSAQRLVAIPHPNVPAAVVEVRLVMYVFG